jgi:hypothetical protein
MKNLSFSKMIVFILVLSFVITGSIFAQNNDWWVERIEWDNGTQTNYIMAYYWNILEQKVRSDYSITITIEGSNWNSLQENEINFRFANVMRSAISRGPGNAATAMAVYTKDNRIVTEIVVIHAERQNDGRIFYWETYWYFD